MSAAATDARPVGRVRWVVVWLLFFAVVINYVDRQMLGVLKPVLDKELGWSETDYANTVFWFQASYAVSFIVFGRMVDRIGARAGYSISFIFWNLAHMAHALASSINGFIAVRIALGIGEAGNFPSAIKATAEWFPQRERAFAVGLFNAGSNIGALVTPLVVPWLAIAYGWRSAFLVTGVISFLWLAAWLYWYRSPSEHKSLSPEERAYINSDAEDDTVPRIPWLRLVRMRETWAVALAKFLIDPIWWMFLFWLPDFFAKTYGLGLKEFGLPLVAIYLLADVGSIFGGWASSRLIRRGLSVNKARKFTFLFLSVFALPVMFAQNVGNLWTAILLLGAATACHQGFSANVYTLATDLFPRTAVSSVLGIGGFVGSIGGMLLAKYAGYFLDTFGTYTPLFILAGCAYFTATLVIHLLSPSLHRVEVGARRGVA